MAIADFPILSPDQASPFLRGAQIGQGMVGKGLLQQYQQLMNSAQAMRNQTLPQTLQEQLLGLQLGNQKSQAELPYAGPQAAANVNLAGGQAAQAYGNAGLTNAQASLLRQNTPNLVKKGESDLYSDPILNRLWQANQAQQSGAIPGGMLSQLGLGGDQGGAQQQPGMQQPGQGQMQGPMGSALPGLGGAPIGGNIPGMAPKMFSGDTAQNWAMFGSPYNPIEMKALESAATAQGSSSVSTYNDALKSAGDTAQDASDMTNYLNQFNQAYKKSSYTGPLAGSAPSSGLTSLPFAIGQDLTPEQTADSAAQNMQALVLKLMHTNKLTNYELQFARNLKLNRNMTPGTVDQVGDFLGAKTTRLKEQQNFLNASRAQGIDAQTAQDLWQRYNNDRPVYDFASNKVNSQYKGSWSDYLKPNMIAAVKQGMPSSVAPGGQGGQGGASAPSDADIQFTAQKYGISPAQVKQRLGLQ